MFALILLVGVALKAKWEGKVFSGTAVPRKIKLLKEYFLHHRCFSFLLVDCSYAVGGVVT